jgi:hypothetical protein
MIVPSSVTFSERCTGRIDSANAGAAPRRTAGRLGGAGARWPGKSEATSGGHQTSDREARIGCRKGSPDRLGALAGLVGAVGGWRVVPAPERFHADPTDLRVPRRRSDLRISVLDGWCGDRPASSDQPDWLAVRYRGAGVRRRGVHRVIRDLCRAHPARTAARPRGGLAGPVALAEQPRGDRLRVPAVPRRPAALTPLAAGALAGRHRPRHSRDWVRARSRAADRVHGCR